MTVINTDEELASIKFVGNISTVKLIVKILVSEHHLKYYTVTEYKLNELVEWQN